MREGDLIRWIRSQIRLDGGLVPVGPGDDAAVVRLGDERLVVTVDQVLDGVHFRLAEHGPRAAGRKAMGRNLSDLAAMAAEPVAAVASVALPKEADEALGRDVYRGLAELADEFACPLVGGDVGTWDGALAISLTALGRVGEVGPVLRSGARPGDALCVTGVLGGAWRGERHLTFTPRVREALELAGRCDVHAMIDLSDGLARDLRHVCEASGVGADVREADVPVSSDAHAASDPLLAALCDGEDYELLLVVPAEQAEGILREPPCGTPITRIGTVTSGPALRLVRADGSETDLPEGGWEHTSG